MKALILIVMVLCWLPFRSNAQVNSVSSTTDTISISNPGVIKELNLSKNKNIDYWYFGLNIGWYSTNFAYKIPKNPRTGLTGTSNGWYSNGFFDLPNNKGLLIQTQTRFIPTKWFTLELANSMQQYNGEITLYEEANNGNWLFGDYLIPRERYNFEIYTNQTTLNPSIHIGSSKVNVNIGYGFGITTLLYAGGTITKQYQFRTFTTFNRLNLGLNFKIGKGLANIAFSANSRTNLAKGNWESYMYFNTTSIGYSLPLSAFKKKSKNVTL